MGIPNFGGAGGGGGGGFMSNLSPINLMTGAPAQTVTCARPGGSAFAALQQSL